MTPAAFAFVPPWAVSLAVGLVAVRFARRSGFGLISLCFTLAAWMSALVLLASGVTWAERLVPCGMLMAGAFVHASAEMTASGSRRLVIVAWAASGAVALLGLVAPRLLFGPGARGPGPLFPALAVLSVLGTLAVKTRLFRLARAAPPGRERRRRWALLIANVLGALGGGGAISLHILGWGPVAIAVPFLVLCVPVAAAAVWSSEDVRGRELLAQGFAFALLTALFSALGLPLFYAAVETLLPGTSWSSPLVVAACFFAALPLDPLRQVLVERVANWLFPRPFTVPALAREIEVQEERADQAERLAELGRIASAVAHEVRNPLGVILAEAKLLEHAGADPESVETLRNQVKRANRFVDELLRYAKPRPLELEEVALGEVVGEAARASARALAMEAAVTIEAETLQIEADRAAVTDVVVNLVSNALIAAGHARVKVAADGDAARIEVEDSGPGVPPQVVGRLFEPFVTGRGRDAKHPGTGLGLALSKRLAERHGATITHERPPGGGARFVVRWPRVPVVASEKAG